MKMFSFSDKNKKQKSDILNFLVVCFLHIFLFFPSLSSLILCSLLASLFFIFLLLLANFFGHLIFFLLDSSMEEEISRIEFDSISIIGLETEVEDYDLIGDLGGSEANGESMFLM